jgi:hypothetical protein
MPGSEPHRVPGHTQHDPSCQWNIPTSHHGLQQPLICCWVCEFTAWQLCCKLVADDVTAVPAPAVPAAAAAGGAAAFNADVISCSPR